MLKIVGGLLVLVSTSLWGINIHRKMKTQTEITDGCIKGLFYLKENIRFSMNNLYDCMLACSKSAGKAEKMFLNSANLIKEGVCPSDALHSSVSDYDLMDENTKNSLYMLCGHLGKTDIEGQILVLDKCISELDLILASLTETLKSKGVLYQKCGIVSGLLIVVLFI